MTKSKFYRSKQVVAVEWWLHECPLPELMWARLRVFNDGTADACWEDGGILYGFDEARFAGYFFSEDEYRRLSAMDAEDDLEYGMSFGEIVPPTWTDRPEQQFKYLGDY